MFASQPALVFLYILELLPVSVEFWISYFLMTFKAHSMFRHLLYLKIQLAVKTFQICQSFKVNDEPQEQPFSTFGLRDTLKAERISSSW